jgi:DNA-binding NtrC family response regulator
LARHFLQLFGQRMNRELKGFEPEAEAVMLALHYPGNVRELENLVERAVALEVGERISPAWLPDPGQTAWLPQQREETGAAAPAPADPAAQIAQTVRALELWMERHPSPLPIEALLDQLERGVLEAALRHSGGNKTDAARALGLTFRSLRYKLAKFGQADDQE